MNAVVAEGNSPAREGEMLTRISDCCVAVIDVRKQHFIREDVVL